MVVGSLREETEVAVIGAGPGGYVAALRAADLGKEVILIEERDHRGGVCLLEGCIPSKALISAVELMHSARDAKQIGITMGDISVDPKMLRDWTSGIVEGLSKGIDGLLKKRGVEVIKGRARFQDNKRLMIEGADTAGVDFKHCIIATGSAINQLPPAYNEPIWTSADALTLPEIPETLLLVGGGYIGLELGLVYAGLGSKVTLVEFNPALLPVVDIDLVQVVMKTCSERFEAMLLGSTVKKVEQTSAGFVTTVEHEGAEQKIETSQVLVAIGRYPNSQDLGLENTNIKPNERGVIPTDEGCRTTEPGIYAIGDVAPGPMLAHKASREGKVAAEVIANHPAAFDNRAIPAVVFTHPEIAWVGLTEREAEAQGRTVNVGRFPLTALGRARTLRATEGLAR